MGRMTDRLARNEQKKDASHESYGSAQILVDRNVMTISVKIHSIQPVGSLGSTGLSLNPKSRIFRTGGDYFCSLHCAVRSVRGLMFSYNKNVGLPFLVFAILREREITIVLH